MIKKSIQVKEWRHKHPEKRRIQCTKYRLKTICRNLGILPKYGKSLTSQQQAILDNINSGLYKSTYDIPELNNIRTNSKYKILSKTFKERIRHNITNSFARFGFTKKSTAYKILGCEWDFFENYIEIQFVENMSWDNKDEWDLDHIIPISLGQSNEEICELCHYTNYQPMWKIQNYEKGDKILLHQISEDNKVRYKKFLDRIL